MQREGGGLRGRGDAERGRTEGAGGCREREEDCRNGVEPVLLHACSRASWSHGLVSQHGPCRFVFHGSLCVVDPGGGSEA